jgi:bacterioferritin-associated ferredoxin
MISCVCANESESKIREYIREGYDTIEKLKEHFEICAKCSLCYPHIHELPLD